jgi:hypothetical protein
VEDSRVFRALPEVSAHYDGRSPMVAYVAVLLRRERSYDLRPTRGGQSTGKRRWLHRVMPGVLFPEFTHSRSGAVTKVGTRRP